MAEVSKPDFETGEPRSILSMHLHARGIRKYQLTPVAWAGGVIPVQSDKYKHLDGSIDDFRQRAVLYSEAPETVIDAPLEYREMIIRSMAIFPLLAQQGDDGPALGRPRAPPEQLLERILRPPGGETRSQLFPGLPLPGRPPLD